MSNKGSKNVVDLARPDEPFQLVSLDPEVFDLLVFHQDGTVRIQTNKSSYFYCTALFTAALDVARLLKNRPAKNLEYGIDKNRILNPDERPNYLCINKEKILEALHANAVTSDWPKVAEFFTHLRSIYDEMDD